MKETVGSALEKALKGQSRERTGRGSSMWTRTREDLFSFLTFRPMSTRKDMSVALGVSDKTVAWHLEKLVERGFVTQRDRRYYPTGFIAQEDQDALVLLASKKGKLFFLSVLKKPGLTMGDVARENDFSRAYTSNMAKAFLDMGMLARVKSGRISHLYPTKWYQNKQEDYRKRSQRFIDHVKNLIEEEGLTFTGVRREATFTAVLKEGSTKYSLVLSTNPMNSILQEENPVSPQRKKDDRQ